MHQMAQPSRHVAQTIRGPATQLLPISLVDGSKSRFELGAIRVPLISPLLRTLAEALMRRNCASRAWPSVISVVDAARTAPVVPVRRDRTPVTQRLPARRYSWLQFEIGNKAAVRQGAFCTEVVLLKSREVRDALVEKCPWLLESDAATLDRLCLAEARAQLLHSHILRVVANQEFDAVPKYLWEEARRADLRALRFADALGLTPLGRARLKQRSRTEGRARTEAVQSEI